MDDIIAVILGGGAGRRLFPLTRSRSKPAVPLAGKYRLIDVPVSNCIHSGIDRIFVMTQFNSASLNRHIARAYQFDRYRSGFVSVLAAEQTPTSHEWFQGTADAVRQSMGHLRANRHSDVLILSGDHLYSMDYREMVEHHRETNADITIATIPVVADDASEFGILKTDAGGIITEFYEKPSRDDLVGKASPVSRELTDSGRVYLASMGIYIFNQGVLKKLLDSNPMWIDFGKQVIPNAIETTKVVSYPYTDFWSDIGTIRSYYEANLMLAADEPPFDMFTPSKLIYTNPRMLPPAKIQNATIRNSLIAESSVIVDASVTDSVIGLRSFLSSGVTVSQSVIVGSNYYRWHDASERRTLDGPDRPGIGEGTRVANAIIDRNASIGRDCVIENAAGVHHADGENYFIRDGIVVIPKNAIVPDGTVI